MSFALAAGTRVLLMDEPTNGLDIPSKSQFRKVVARCMTDVLVSQTGCMGFCQHEPTIEVAVPGMESTVYGDVKGAAVEQIINTHLVGKQVLKDLVLEKPSIDIIKEA